MTHNRRRELDQLAADIVALKHRCGELEMYKTMHTMEPAVTAVGFEMAEELVKDMAQELKENKIIFFEARPCSR